MALISQLTDLLFGGAASRARRLRVTYRVELQSNGAPATGHLILPVPRSIGNQEIDGAPEFSTEPLSLGSDPVYKNSFAVWPISLGPNKNATLEETFIVATKPTRMSINETWRLGDYKNPDRLFLQPNRFVQGDAAHVQKLAAEVMTGTDYIKPIVERANRKVQELLTYGNPIPGLYTAAQALDIRTVDCGGFDTLLVSILNACGIPARVVSGFWLGYPKNDMHAWVEIQLPDGTWLPADPSVEQLRNLGRSKKQGSLGQIGSDRLITSVGSDIAVRIQDADINLDILQCPVIHPSSSGIQATWTVETEPA